MHQKPLSSTKKKKKQESDLISSLTIIEENKTKRFSLSCRDDFIRGWNKPQIIKLELLCLELTGTGM